MGYEARTGSLRGPPGTILENLEDPFDTLRALASQGAADLIIEDACGDHRRPLPMKAFGS